MWKSEVVPSAIAQARGSLILDIRRRDDKNDVINPETLLILITQTEFLQSKENAQQTAQTQQVEWRKVYCAKCEKTLNGQHEYDIHLRSKGSAPLFAER